MQWNPLLRIRLYACLGFIVCSGICVGSRDNMFWGFQFEFVNFVYLSCTCAWWRFSFLFGRCAARAILNFRHAETPQLIHGMLQWLRRAFMGHNAQENGKQWKNNILKGSNAITLVRRINLQDGTSKAAKT